MKFLVYIFLFFTSLAFGQTHDSAKKTEPEVFKPVDVAPSYIGGFPAMVKFIEKTLIYPKEDKEAIRVVSVMPKWKPGSQTGTPVSVYFNLPISFNPKNY